MPSKGLPVKLAVVEAPPGTWLRVAVAETVGVTVMTGVLLLLLLMTAEVTGRVDELLVREVAGGCWTDEDDDDGAALPGRHCEYQLLPKVQTLPEAQQVGPV